MSSKIETTAPLPTPAPVAKMISPNIPTPSSSGSEVKQKIAEGIKKIIAKQSNIQDMQAIDLSFGIDKATERVYVEVKDKATGEVLKQIPSKDYLEMMARIQSAVNGLFVDAKG